MTKEEMDQLPGWGLEEKPIEATLVEEFETNGTELGNVTWKIAMLSAEIETLETKKHTLLDWFRVRLNHFGKKNYQSAAGTIEFKDRLSFTTPKTPEDKKALFEWLQSKGVFWDYASVNSNSLNSLCKQEADIAKEEGRELNIPGIKEPSNFTTIHFKPSKK